MNTDLKQGASQLWINTNSYVHRLGDGAKQRCLAAVSRSKRSSEQNWLVRFYYYMIWHDMIWCTSHERMLFKTKMKYYSHIGRRRGESTLIVHHDTIDGNCDRRRKRPKKQMTQTMRKLNIYQWVHSSKLHHTSCMRFIHRKNLINSLWKISHIIHLPLFSGCGVASDLRSMWAATLPPQNIPTLFSLSLASHNIPTWAAPVCFCTCPQTQKTNFTAPFEAISKGSSLNCMWYPIKCTLLIHQLNA